MGLIVQKYGGTSVADVDCIGNVAQRVAATYDAGNDVVVILSAMAGVTDALINLAHEASQEPSKRELDVLLATGEQTTAALLAMMLEARQYPAQSLLGHQAEVLTEAAGVTLGPVQSISYYNAYPMPIYAERGYADAGEAMAFSADVPISAGEMTITVDVSVVYEIR